MKGKLKQILSFLLVLLFVVSLLPSAIAEEELPGTVTEESENPAEEPEAGEPAEQPSPEQELPDGIAGMPKGYVMSEATIAEKQALIDHDVLATLENMTPGKDYVEDEVLVSAATEEEAKTIAAAYNAELVSFNGHFAVLRLRTISVRDAVAAGMDMQLALPPVDPNYITTLDPVEYGKFIVPAEKRNEANWLPQRNTWDDYGLNDPLLTDPSNDYYYQYMHDMVNSYAAWGVTQGWWPVVAVIDTGVDYNHEEFIDTRYDSDGNEYTSSRIIKGYDYVDGDDDPMDENGHGTHCAGIVAAGLYNNVGGAGIAPNVRILAVRVLNEKGSGTDEQVCNGIYYAAEKYADILSMSLGGLPYSNAKQNAVKYANQQGATVIAAMGNDGTNVKRYPAALDGVIAVAAVNPSGERAPYSNYGKWCDIAAPGSDIWSTTPGDSYDCWDGTSMATPVVAGAAAVYISFLGYNPGPAQVEKALLAATNKCKSKDCGKGIIDVSKLVNTVGTIGFDVWTWHEEYDSEWDEYWTVWDEYRGSSSDLSHAVISPDTLLYFRINENNGDGSVIYTLDGSTPSVDLVNGNVTNGIQSWTAYMSEFMPGDKVTVKVMYVNGLGAASKVSTYTFTVAPKAADTDELSDCEVRIHAPSVMIPGKTITLSATLGQPYVEEGYYQFDQSFTWKILSNSNCPNAKIDAKTGKLTTKAGEVGTVTVRATSVKYPGKYKNWTVKLQQVNPIGTITLDHASASLYSWEWHMVSIASLLDNKKNNVAIDSRTYRWTSSNPQVVRVMQWYSTGECEIQAAAKGSATITCEVLDGSGKKVTFKVNVLQSATDITISGPGYIAAGNSATYQAALLPKGTKEKVVWSLVSAPSGVTIDAAKGLVKVPASVKSGSIRIHAETPSGNCYDNFDIGIVSAKATSVNIKNYTTWGSASYPLVTWKNGNIDSITLYSMNTNHDGDCENELQLVATVSNGTTPVWTSSNPKIVRVYSDGYVCANGVAGTATITCATQDGSGKKATVKVKVINPVSQIFIQSKNPAFRLEDSMHLIGIGKSASNTPVFGTTYGVPSNKKVTWSFNVYQEDLDGSNWTNITNEAKSKGWVKLSTSGSLSVDKKIQSKWQSTVNGDRNIVIYVWATATDGTNAEGLVRYVVTPLTQKLTTTLSNNTITLKVNNKSSYFYVYNELGGYYGDYTITSSNPDIAGAVVDEYYLDAIYVRVISGRKTGTAKITIKANDGSNKSVTVTVKVTN